MSHLLDARVSVFKPGQLSAPAGDVPLREVLEAVRTGKYAVEIGRVRAESNTNKRRDLKFNTLRAITLSGVFAQGVSIKGAQPVTYSGVVQIDIDHVPNPAALRDALATDAHILFSHLSPSGTGVKAGVCVPADNATHDRAFRAACDHIAATYDVTPDKSAVNINRPFYLSSDKDAKVNANAVPLPLPDEVPEPAPVVAADSTGTGYAVEEVRRALAVLPDRPPYGDWLKWSNAVRDAVGESKATELLRSRWPEEQPEEYAKKINELTDITAGTLFFDARAHGWMPEIYYENRSDRYHARSATGEFRSYPAAHAKGVLADFRTPKDETETMMHRIRHECCIDLALNVSGETRGLHEMSGQRVLVPSGPRYITPVKGDWPTLRAIWIGMLGDEQFEWFIHWLGSSVRSYYAGKWQPAQVVAFIGPTASGKSLTQSVLTTMFGDRAVDVMQVITGGTEFNGDWAEATHLMVEDKFSDNTKAVRERVKESVKAIAVNRQHRIHPKGKQAIQILPFWRMTVSCNPTVGSLAVLPPLDDSVRNKISLLWTGRFEMPMPAETADEKQKLWSKIEQELPALIHHLLAMGKAPQHLRDPEGRFDVRAFHHTEALKQHHRLTPEGEVLENILEALAEENRPEFIGTAKELLAVMDYADRRGHQTSKSLGRHLMALAQSRPERVKLHKQSESHGNQYVVTIPEYDLV